MQLIKRSIFFLFLSGIAWADQCQITSPLPMPVTISGCTYAGTGASSSLAVNQNGVQISSPTAALNFTGAGVSVSLVGGVTAQINIPGGGGGGSSSLAVEQDLVIISSPTGVLNYPGSQFVVSNPASSTATITLNNSSVTLQGNNLSATYLTNSSATATYLQLSSATATYLQQSSATATYLQLSSATATYANKSVTTALQSNFPVSMSTNTTGLLAVANGGTGTASPTISAGTNITSVTGTWPNVTINAATQSGSGGGSSSLAIQQNAVNITSPTVAVNFLAPPFLVSLVNTSTSQVKLDGSSVTLQGVVTAASLGALTANQSITWTGSGDVSGTASGATSISPTLTAASRQSNITTLAASSETVTGNMEVDGYTLHKGSVSVTAGTGLGVTYGITASSVAVTSATASGQFTAGTYQGGGLSTCGSTSQAVSWTGGSYGCTTITAAGLGALTANQSITLSGDASGSGTTAISVTNAATQANIAVLSHAITATSSVTVTGAGGVGVTFGVLASTVVVSTGDFTSELNLPLIAPSAAGDLSYRSTNEQVVYEGASSSRTLSDIQTKCMTIDSPTATDNYLMFRAYRMMRFVEVDCLVNAATSVLMTPQACDANGANCANIVAQQTCAATNTQASATTTIVAGGYIRLVLSTVTGSVGHLSTCITMREEPK